MATIKNLNEVAATSNQTGSAIDTGGLFMKCGNIGVQAVGTGLSTSDSTITIQQSNDGTNWDTVMDGYDVFTITMASGSTSQSRVLSNMAMGFLRGVYTKNTNAAGTISLTLNFV